MHRYYNELSEFIAFRDLFVAFGNFFLEKKSLLSANSSTNVTAVD